MPSQSPLPSPSRGSVGDRVWLDLNGNGLQDAGEPGAAGVTVQLLQGSTVVDTTTTDGTGFYTFPNVVAGTYTVVFQRPSGFGFTTSLVGGLGSSTNSKADALTGATNSFTVSAGQAVTNIDAGLVVGMASFNFHFWFILSHVPVAVW